MSHTTRLTTAIQDGNLKEVKRLTSWISRLISGLRIDSEDFEGVTALALAAYCGRAEIVDFLLTKDPSSRSINSAFREAVKKGHQDIVMTLLQRGIDTDNRGQGLLDAIWTENLELTEFLLRVGASPSYRDSEGFTPLKYAVEKDQKEIAQLLLAADVSPNVKDDKGNAPLMYARSTEMIELLISHGADVNTRNAFDFTPRKIFKQHGYHELAKIIEEAGGKE